MSPSNNRRSPSEKTSPGTSGKAEWAARVAVAAAIAFAALGAALAWHPAEGRHFLSADAIHSTADAGAPTLPSPIAGKDAEAFCNYNTTQAAISAPPDADEITRQLNSSVLDLLEWAKAGRIPSAPRAGEEVLDLQNSDSAPVLIRRWTRTDPNAAESWCLSLPDSGLKTALLQQIAYGIADADPSAAVKWAEAMPSGTSRDSVVGNLGWEISGSDPVSALDLAAVLPDGQARTQLLQHSIAEWARSDPQNAVAWAKQIDTPDLRNQALEGIVTAVSGTDPATAVTIVAEDIPPGEVQTRAATELVQRWARQEPQAASQWVQDFPPGATAEAATANLVSLWAQTDTQASWQWLATLRDSGMRDAGFTALARATGRFDPDFATRCYSQVSNQPPPF